MFASESRKIDVDFDSGSGIVDVDYDLVPNEIRVEHAHVQYRIYQDQSMSYFSPSHPHPVHDEPCPDPTSSSLVQ